MTEGFEKLPPSDIEAEKCVIASLLLCDADVMMFSDIKAMVDHSSFYQADHSIMFKILMEMQFKAKQIDAITFRDELAKRQLLDDVGGVMHIADILNTVPSAAHGVAYAKIVREKYMLRQIIGLANEMLRTAYGPLSGDVSDIAIECANKATLIGVNGSDENIVELKNVLIDVATETGGPSVARKNVGLTDLDNFTGGIGRGEFTLVGGRPGAGKSQFIKQAILNCAKLGVRCGMISIEESRRKIGHNVLANMSGIENNKIVRGQLDAMSVEAVLQAANNGTELNVFIDDVSRSLPKIEAAIVKMVTKHQCEMISVDHLHLIDDPGTSQNDNREMTLISRALKMLFKRLNVYSLVACQLNRGGESREIRKPTLKDLRGSGSLEQDGDIIMLLHREDYYRQHEENYRPTHQLEAIVAKNKNNAQCLVPLHFSGRFQRITDWNGGFGIDPNAPKYNSHSKDDPFAADEAA